MAYTNLRIGTIDTPIDLNDAALYMSQIVYGDETRMAAANADGGVIAWVTPDYNKIHCAWNAIRFVAFQMLYEVGDTHAPADAPKAKVNGSDVYFFVNTEYVGEFTLNVTNAAGDVYTLKADGMRTKYHGVAFVNEGSNPYGGAEFNVAPFARESYKHITWLWDNSVTSLIVEPAYENVPLYVLNGVAQQGESSQLPWIERSTKKLLTRQTIMRPWGANWRNEYGGDYNYDFGPEFAPDFSVQPIIAGGDPEATIMTTDEYGVPTVERVRIHDYEDVLAINAELGYDALTWESECKGIAVRWLNDIGGVDGFVFTPRSRYQRKAKTKSYAALYAPDTYDVKDTIDVYDIETEDLLVLGVDSLPREQYEVLKWLAVSRDVAIFMPAVSVPTNRWQSVTIEDYNVDNTGVQNTVDFEITIRLPKLNVMI
jgi:hypothetical protein